MKRRNLWAPWRIKYIQGLTEESGCFICRGFEHPEDDDENLVLWRTELGIVMFNKFPYNNGHLMVAPVRHIADMSEAKEDELLAMSKLVRDSQKVLSEAISPHGFNIGMNFGRCAGAGLVGHMHIHVVPRWDGDTNFMPVLSGTDIISQSLTELLEHLREVSEKNNLPDV